MGVRVGVLVPANLNFITGGYVSELFFLPDHELIKNSAAHNVYQMQFQSEKKT